MKRLWVMGLLLAASSAHADWTQFATGAGGNSKHFLDLETVKATGTTVRAWLLSDYLEDVPLRGGNGKYRSYKSLNEYNCATEQIRVLAYSASSGQMGAGTVVSSDMDSSKPGAWNETAPESIAQGGLVAVCQATAILKRTRAWTAIGALDGVSLFIDRSSVRRSGDAIEARTMYDYSSAQTHNELVWRSAVFDLEIDCANQTFRTLFLVSYVGPRAEGSAVEIVSGAKNKHEAYAPDGVVAKQARVLCASRGS
jgi:hypothetical protein